MKTYRIMNRITKEWWEGEADSAQEACHKAGWMIGDCWVRVKTSKAGWGKPREAQPR
jgi:hypothetical protein